ncbi:MAG: RNA 2',3'-cyclic phosphodiesterase [Acidobacteria bacterium]|nr:RNA 2',3'-cyclic phosphodiesterase [Acidobacteriota bacterium]
MRLFVAVDVSEDARRTAVGVTRRLTRDLEKLGVGRDIKWVPAENLHLTLQFIGPVDEERGAAIETAMREPLATGAFELGLNGAGAFPPSGAPRVIWIGISSGMPELQALHADVEARLAPFGIETEQRAFAAHLTLARFRQPSPRGADIRRLLSDMPVRAEPWTVDRVTLYESKLSPKGPKYLPVRYTVLSPGR